MTQAELNRIGDAVTELCSALDAAGIEGGLGGVVLSRQACKTLGAARWPALPRTHQALTVCGTPIYQTETLHAVEVAP